MGASVRPGPFADLVPQGGPFDDLLPAATRQVPRVAPDVTRVGPVTTGVSSHFPEPLRSVSEFLVDPMLENPITTAASVAVWPVGAAMAAMAGKRVVDYGAQKAAEVTLPPDQRALAEADPGRIPGREAATLAAAFAAAPLIHAGAKAVRGTKPVAPEFADLVPRGTEERHAGMPNPLGLLDLPPIKRITDAVNVIASPASRTPEAGKAAGIIRAHSGAMARTYEQAATALQEFRGAAEKLPEQDRLAFIDRMENGKPQTTPGETAAAATIRKTLDTTRDEIRGLGTGALDHFIQDYFPHIWEQPDEASLVIGRIMGKRPLEGPRSFLKQRTIPTIAEGMEAGLKPISTNPVDLTMLKLREMQRYLMGQRVMGELKTQGLAALVRAGETPPPGYARINDRVATVYGPREGAVKLPEGANVEPGEVAVPGRRIMGEYWAPEPVTRVLNNYLSPGLRGNALYDAFRGFGNVLNQAQLGLSAFHLGFTSMDAAVSRTALGIEQMVGGKPLTALKTALSTPLAPLTNILEGRKLRAEYLKPGTEQGDYAALARAVEDAGGRVRMDSFYNTAAPTRFMDAWRRGEYGKAAWNSVPAFFQTAMKPIMEHVVPMQKLGVFADLARNELGKLPAEATVAEQRAVMAKAWDSVDNRLGQLVYDNLFWDKTFKDLALASVRSVGWNLGTIRELGGGVKDVARGELTHRSAYIAALPITVGLAGAVLHYLYTGKGPETLKDYFYPQTGTFDADGNPNRVQLPSYMKDVAAYGRHPWQTIGHKVNPAITVVKEMLDNQDFYGDQIRNEEAPAVQQMLESAKYFGEQFLPFAIRNVQEEARRSEGTTAKVGPFVGITPAPREMVKTPAQNLMQRVGPQPGRRTLEQAEAQKTRSDVLRGLRGAPGLDDALDRALSGGNMTTPQFNTLLRRAGTLPMQERFKALSLKDALRVFDAGDAREQALWFPILQDKIARAGRTGGLLVP